MSKTDFSISSPTFVQFEYNGWPNAEKSLLENSVRALGGVTEVNQAGARSSIHVHYDPSEIDRDDLITSVNKIAGPIFARLQSMPMELEEEPDKFPLDVDTRTSPSEEGLEGTSANQLEASDLITGPPNIASSPLKIHDAISVHTASSPTVSSDGFIRSSAWTGNKSLPEQCETIRNYAPLALAGLYALTAAIEDKRYNDEATEDALRILKELRDAIDALVQAAEGGRPHSALWQAVEHRTNDLIEAARTGAKVIVGAPIVGLGAAYAISLLTGDPITGQMVATMAGGSLMASSMSKADKKA